MTLEVEHSDFGVIIENPLTIEDLNELLIRLPNIITAAKAKERTKTETALAKAEDRITELRKYLESLT